jgi:UDP-glucose 4-epimerase
MKAVVTGATGHLGSYLVWRLAAAGWEVVAASRSGRAPPAPFETVANGEIRPLPLDIEAEASVSELSAELGPEVSLVHLAAYCPVATAATTPADRRRLFDVNCLGTMRVLDAARVAGIRSVIYASSFEVYGIPSEPVAATETAPTRPVTDYGVSKLAGEDHAFSFAVEQGVRAVALRMPAIYGPGESTSRALPNFLRAVAAGRRPKIFGDGLDLRDQLHAADAAAAVELALECSASGAFNISDGEPHSILEIARLALRAAEFDAEPEFLPDSKRRFPFHMSISKAQRDLGFRPAFELLEGMRQELRWIASLAHKA